MFRRRVLSLVAFGVIVLSGWLVREVYQVSRYGSESLRIRRALASLHERRPADISPGEWEVGVNWAVTAHCNVCFSRDHTGYEAMARYGAEVDGKLAGTVDLGTLRWVWDRLAETGATGARYNERFREDFETQIRWVGGSDNADDKKRQEERKANEERLRNATPTEEHEITKKKGNDQLIELLKKADKMELFRLEPMKLSDELQRNAVTLHGYKIVTRTSVEKVEGRTELVTSLGKELHWVEYWKAQCFNPRHGLRVVVGKDTWEFVICMECHRMRVYQGDKSAGEIVLLGSKWGAADKLLQEAEEKAKGSGKK